MRKYLLLLSIVCAASAQAQLNGDGYYRVKNKDTERYITVVDGYGRVDVQGLKADATALKTIKPWNEVVSNPASIIYIKKGSENYGYNLFAQGVNSYNFYGRELLVRPNADAYRAYASEKGTAIYLTDKKVSPFASEDAKNYASVETSTNANQSNMAPDWYILPVGDNCIFGVLPDITVGASYYKSFCACFPFSFRSAGMTAYKVAEVNEAKAYALIQEVTGTIAGGTPLIIKCASTDPANNRLDITGTPVVGQKPITSAGNLLKGVYFANTEYRYAGGDLNPHYDAVPYDAATMRVLGKTADGKLAFIKDTTLEFIPANTCYITVSASAPNEILAVTEVPQLPGDLNGDGEVDIQDLGIIAKSITSTQYNANFDLNNDGTVDIQDLGIIVKYILNN